MRDFKPNKNNYWKNIFNHRTIMFVIAMMILVSLSPRNDNSIPTTVEEFIDGVKFIFIALALYFCLRTIWLINETPIRFTHDGFFILRKHKYPIKDLVHVKLSQSHRNKRNPTGYRASNEFLFLELGLNESNYSRIIINSRYYGLSLSEASAKQLIDLIQQSGIEEKRKKSIITILQHHLSESEYNGKGKISVYRSNKKLDTADIEKNDMVDLYERYISDPHLLPER